MTPCHYVNPRTPDRYPTGVLDDRVAHSDLTASPVALAVTRSCNAKVGSTTGDDDNLRASRSLADLARRRDRHARRGDSRDRARHVVCGVREARPLPRHPDEEPVCRSFSVDRV